MEKFTQKKTNLCKGVAIFILLSAYGLTYSIKKYNSLVSGGGKVRQDNILTLQCH